MFGKFSFAGNRVTVLHLATRVFLAGNHISDEQRVKEQESRRKAKEHERRGYKMSEESLKRSRGRRRKKILNENHRKAERNTARDKTLIYNG